MSVRRKVTTAAMMPVAVHLAVKKTSCVKPIKLRNLHDGLALKGACTLWVYMLTNHSIDRKFQYCV